MSLAPEAWFEQTLPESKSGVLPIRRLGNIQTLFFMEQWPKNLFKHMLLQLVELPRFELGFSACKADTLANYVIAPYKNLIGQAAPASYSQTLEVCRLLQFNDSVINNLTYLNLICSSLHFMNNIFCKIQETLDYS